MKSAFKVCLIVAASIFSFGVASSELACQMESAQADASLQGLRNKALRIFGSLPKSVDLPDGPATPEKIVLGHVLYFDKRLSLADDLSCATCHPLDRYAVDGEVTSKGHLEQRGDRNAPTIYNAALNFAQLWDGRKADLVEQGTAPIINPIEMAMPDEAALIKKVKQIKGYQLLFDKAFEGEGGDALTARNLGEAIAAFESQLLTPAPFDRFLAGEDDALNSDAAEGLRLFLESGCANCHNGPNIGGASFQKLGSIKPYPTNDPGRQKITGAEADRGVFKVPGLRNVQHTAPYFHDGSIASLEQAVGIMAEHQTVGGKLSGEQNKKIVAFLNSLTGELPKKWLNAPPMPQ